MSRPEAKMLHDISTVRRAMANDALKHVKTMLTRGTPNAQAGLSVIPKFDLIFKHPKSSFSTVPEDFYEMGILQKKHVINRKIAALKDRIGEIIANLSGRGLRLSEAETRQLPAVIAYYLLFLLFKKEVEAPCETIPEMVHHVQLTELFKAGNCGDQALMAFIFLLKTQVNNPALYPIRMFEAHKSKPEKPAFGTDPEDKHQVILMGHFTEEQEVQHKGVFTESDQLVCDPWLNKCFNFSTWNAHVPPGLHLQNLDFDKSSHFFKYTDPSTVQKGLEASKPLNLDLTSKEVDHWVDQLNAIVIDSLKPRSTLKGTDIKTTSERHRMQPGPLLTTQNPLLRFTVSGVDQPQRDLITRVKGTIEESKEKREVQVLLPQSSTEEERRSVRIALGLTRLRIKKASGDTLRALKKDIPGITIDLDLGNPEQHIVTYPQQHDARFKALMKDKANPKPNPNPSAKPAVGAPLSRSHPPS